MWQRELTSENWRSSAGFATACNGSPARSSGSTRLICSSAACPRPPFWNWSAPHWFAEQLRALGWSASIDRAGNVVAADGEGPYVALTAHLDTVIAPRNKDEITVDADGRFRGPGVSDNGAGLAALLAMARVWKSGLSLPELPLNLLLVANVGEEGEGNLLGMRHLCKQSPLARKIESFVVVDGANTDHITSRALGSRRFEVAFTGAGGHSWSDFGVGNPVHALCRAVALFAETRLDAGPPKSAYQCGVDRRRVEHQCDRATGPRQGGYPLRNATKRWTNWWSC